MLNEGMGRRIGRDKAQKAQNHKSLCAFCAFSRLFHCVQSGGFLEEMEGKGGLLGGAGEVRDAQPRLIH